MQNSIKNEITRRITNVAGAFLLASLAACGTSGVPSMNIGQFSTGARSLKAIQLVSNNGYPTRDGIACYERPGLTVSMLNSPQKGDTVVATSRTDTTRVVRLVSPDGSQFIGRMNGDKVDPSKDFYGSGNAVTIQNLIHAAASKARQADALCAEALRAVPATVIVPNLGGRLPPMGQRVDPAIVAAAGWPSLVIGPPKPNQANVFSLYGVQLQANPQQVDAAGYWYAAGGTNILGRPPDLTDRLPEIVTGEGRRRPAPAQRLNTAPAQ